MIDHRAEHDLARAAAERLRAEGFGGAKVVVQTGSGIAAPDLAGRRTLAWTDVPGMPHATAPGHRGAFHHGLCRGVPTLVLEGRLHVYEGHEPAHVVRPIRAAALLGVPCAVLTNASGGVRPGLRAGDIVRVRDHINLMGFDPLTGVHDPRLGERFVVLAGRAHDPALHQIATTAAAALGLPLADGVYAAVHGPSFETGAQVRFLRTIGADLVGMSTVPEVIALTQFGVRTLVLSMVANPAGEVAAGQTAEAEVLDAGKTHGARLTRLLEEIVARIGAEARS
jgi:purine-nucleoside phosphorylase